MGEQSKIEWCDHTASPWYGCTKISSGCTNCYAATLSKRNPGTLGIWGDDGTRVKSKSFIANLRKWNRDAERTGKVASVFPSMCDPFEDRPELVEWRNEMFAVADELPWIRLLLLTKRPENIRRMWPFKADQEAAKEIAANEGDAHPYYRPNVWLLTSIANQSDAESYVLPLVCKSNFAPVYGLSIEPMLGPIDLTRIEKGGGETYNALTGEITTHRGHTFRCSDTEPIRWVIVGGESGHGARPMHPDWARSLRDQCVAANVAFFFKQWGEWAPWMNEDHFTHCGEEKHAHAWLDSATDKQGLAWIVDDDGSWSNWTGDPPTDAGGQCLETVAVMGRVGKKAAGRLLDGREWNETPNPGA